MGLLSGIILGIMVGLLAGFITHNRFGVIGDIIVGVAGAIVGQMMGNAFLNVDGAGLNLSSILLGTVGAVLMVVLFRAFMGKGIRVLVD